jgi:hypothetical protein
MWEGAKLQACHEDRRMRMAEREFAVEDGLAYDTDIETISATSAAKHFAAAFSRTSP